MTVTTPGTRFIGTKQVTAWPEDKMDGSIAKAGYAVVYPDGYKSWSPEDVFEKAYLSMGQDNINKITQQMVDDFINDTCVTSKMGEKTTVVMATLRNGFIIVESSTCVDSDNYDEKIGTDICLSRIKNKVWELLGFLLQTARYGISN